MTSSVPDVTSDLTQRPTIADVYDEGALSYAEHWAPALHRHARGLADLVPPPPPGHGRTVLDVAAGAGTLLPSLRPVAGEPAAGGRLVALDYSAGMLALVDPTVPRVRADAAALPLADACADVAVYWFVSPCCRMPGPRWPRPRAFSGRAAGCWPRPGAVSSAPQRTSSSVRRSTRSARRRARPCSAPTRSPPTVPTGCASLLEPVGFTDVATSAGPLDAQFDAPLHTRDARGLGKPRLAVPPAHSVGPGAGAGNARPLGSPRLGAGPASFLDRSAVQLTIARRS